MNGVEKETRIYQCDGSFYGVLSAVYEAGISGYGHEYIRIEILGHEDSMELSLFSHYITIDTEAWKAEKVISSVKKKIGYKAYIYMLHAGVSGFGDRGNVIYQFLTYGFSMGPKVCDAMQLPFVKRIFEIYRKVGNVAHFSKEFMRFQEVKNQPPVLFAMYEPEHKVTTLIAEHFADRFPEETFIIYDKAHKEAAIHPKGQAWYMRFLTEDESAFFDELGEKKEEYVDLWKTFFHSIAIKERENKDLQRNMMPLHYRKHVTEWIE